MTKFLLTVATTILKVLYAVLVGVIILGIGNLILESFERYCNRVASLFFN